MVFIAKWPQFSWYKDPSWAAVLVHSCTHRLIQAADPAWGELFRHIGIPCLYDLLDLPEAIPEGWWLPCCDCKGLQDCFKLFPGHEWAQSHWGTNKTINLTHGPKIHVIWTVDCCHAEPQAQPMKELSITDRIMFFFLQAYVGLRDDDPFNIWLEEKHLKQLLDCWLHVCVEAQVCLVFVTKTVIAIPRMLPGRKELWGILSFFSWCWNILWQWLIVIINHAREYLLDKVCIIRVQC